MVKALVIAGDGVNCERETAKALEIVGFDSQIININYIDNSFDFKSYNVFAFPGGFSYGDELGSGKLFALKVKYRLSNLLDRIQDENVLTIGICNGFQALVSLGILPNIKNGKQASLRRNLSQSFERKPFLNQWVTLNSKLSNCIWTKKLDQIDLPIRHGEGRIVLSEDTSFEELMENKQCPLFYEEDINGSVKRLASLSDPSGRIFGLMPHPEAAIYGHLHPGKIKSEYGDGYKIFKNAFEYFQ